VYTFIKLNNRRIRNTRPTLYLLIYLPCSA